MKGITGNYMESKLYDRESVIRKKWMDDYMRIHSDSGNSVSTAFASPNTISLDEAFGLLKKKKINGSAPLCAFFVIVKNADYIPPRQIEGKMKIQPMTKERLAAYDKTWIAKMEERRMKCDAPFMLRTGGIVSADRTTDSYYTEQNMEIIKNVFEKYDIQM